MTARITTLIAALLVATTVAPGSAAAAERQVEALYKKARTMYGCSERWASGDVAAECRKVIAAYRAAEAASDATPADRNFLTVERLKRQATLVGVLRQSEDLTTARKELEAGFRDLDAIAPGDTNAFLRVQTLDLQRQAALLALDSGAPARADAAIAEFRKHSQGFLAALEQVRGNDKAMNQQRLNAVDAANFEFELGEYYASLLKDGKVPDAQATMRNAVEAFELARQWALVRAENDWNGFAEKAPRVLYADASLELSQLAHDANETQTLARFVGEAKAVACAGGNEDSNYDEAELGERCLQATLMEGWVTGANQALMRKISEQNDAQMRQVMDALRRKSN